MKPTLHLIGIFHTKHQESFSHCAFTGKALRFPKMMQMYGYKIIEYSNEGSESTADEKVVMLTDEEYRKCFGERNPTTFYGDDATIGSVPHQSFESKLIPALRERINPQDIICHPFGHAHSILMSEFPNHQHVETGIGYSTLMENSFRIFESYAWMHHHQEKEKRSGRNYEWVVPNYYDLNDWEPNYEKGKYLAFLGRICSVKGLDTIKAIADNCDVPIILHGQGDASEWNHLNIHYGGPIHGKERSDFLRNAKAILAPSNFIEPFCGMSVEAMLCGTPVISVDYGAMTETVQEGMGFRCHTLQDWLDAINDVDELDRKYIADTARSKYSLETCGKKYDKIFMQLNDLHRKGWYQLRTEEDIYDHEKSFWGDCTNTYGEDLKHYVYAKYMSITQQYYSFDAQNKAVLDIGGGPTSMMLKCYNLPKGKVVDPIAYPDWTVQRYKSKNIDVLVDCAENIDESGWDEVWIYNCLQHTIDPQKIIENAKRAAPVLRIFEWVDIPAHDGHPHELTEDNLNSWIGQRGQTVTLAESNCYGKAYYGCFNFDVGKISYPLGNTV
jgi:hypothetical protein